MKRRLHVLVVDDEPHVLTVTCRMIERLSHEAVSAESGVKAIQLLQSDVFDLAIVDTQMPGINGDDVRRFIRQNLPTLKVITASGIPPSMTPGEMQAGQHVYLRKPYHMHQLRNAIEKLFEAEAAPPQEAT